MTELKMLNLTNLYTLRVCVETHPFIHPRSQLNRPEHNHTYISTAQIHHYPTRHSQQQHFYIPNTSHRHTRAKPSAHTIDYTTERNTRAWNSIPPELRAIQGLRTFKAKLKEHLLEAQSQT